RFRRGEGSRAARRRAVPDARDARRRTRSALRGVVRASHGFDEIASVATLDEVRDALGVALRRERVALIDESQLALAVVLDDAVQHDAELAVVAPRQRVCVLLADALVRRPARVAEPGARARSVRSGG